MMMRTLNRLHLMSVPVWAILLLGMAGTMMSLSRASAANGVAIESKIVAPGDTAVAVGIHIENDIEIAGLVIPIEIRSLDTGAYIAGSLGFSTQGRLKPWRNGVTFKVVRIIGTPSADAKYPECVRGSSGGSWGGTDTLDFISPDALIYSCVGVEPRSIAPGNDGQPGEGIPSLLLSFGVTNTPGKFVIDTTCIPPANHFTFVAYSEPDDKYEETPAYFQKAVIEIKGR